MANTGIPVRFVYPLRTKNADYVAYFTWNCEIAAEKFLHIMRFLRPVTMLRVADFSIAFSPSNDSLLLCVEDGTFDILLKTAFIDLEQTKIIPDEGLLDLFSRDPSWTVEKIQSIH